MGLLSLDLQKSKTKIWLIRSKRQFYRSKLKSPTHNLEDMSHKIAMNSALMEAIRNQGSLEDIQELMNVHLDINELEMDKLGAYITPLMMAIGHHPLAIFFIDDALPIRCEQNVQFWLHCIDVCCL